MNKLFTLIASFVLVFAAKGNAQVFWTENFTGSGTIASGGFTSTNGTWTAGATGTEDPQHNEWYVSCTEAGHIAGACGSVCGVGDLGATLHVGSTTIGDMGASYDAGGFCPILWCVTTDRRAVSPTINCFGKTNIRLKFYYIMNGQTGLDYGSVYYSPDNGASWVSLGNPPQTSVCPSSQGRWDSISYALPSAANNNPTVKIAFRWVNNDDGTGTDPSFAIDSVSLKTPAGSGPVSASMTASATTVCEDSCLTFTNTSTGTVDSFRFVCAGATIASPGVSPCSVCFPNPGTQTVKLYLYNGGVKVDSASSTITVNPAPHPVITKTTSTLSVPAVYTSYQWYVVGLPPTAITGATNATYTYTVGGTYGVVVDSGGCKGAASLNTLGVNTIDGAGNSFWLSQAYGNILSLYAAQATDEPILVDIYDATGRKVFNDTWQAGSSTKQISNMNLSSGLYIIRLSNATSAAVLKWLKE